MADGEGEVTTYGEAGQASAVETRLPHGSVSMKASGLLDHRFSGLLTVSILPPDNSVTKQSFILFTSFGKIGKSVGETADRHAASGPMTFTADRGLGRWRHHAGA